MGFWFLYSYSVSNNPYPVDLYSDEKDTKNYWNKNLVNPIMGKFNKRLIEICYAPYTALLNTLYLLKKKIGYHRKLGSPETLVQMCYICLKSVTWTSEKSVQAFL